MTNAPLVSFIMPTYNRAYIIQTAINSILAQTRSNWELIVVDDGSTDDTKQLVAAIGDPRIRYYYQQNKGAGAARNIAIGYAKGEWIAYLDSDNELYPNYLEVMLRELKAHPHAVFAIPRAKRTLELYKDGKLVKLIDNSDDTPPGLTIKDIFMKKLHLDTNGFIHLRRIFGGSIQWDTRLYGMDDWDLAMRIGTKYPKGFLYVEEVLYNYHQRYGGDGIVSNATYKDWARTFEVIYQTHKDSPLLVGQEWYPSRVEKWNKLQEEFETGQRGPYYLYYFENI